MAKAVLFEANAIEYKYTIVKQISLVQIPTRGDLIVHNIEGIGYVYRIDEVHYAEGE